MYIYALYTCTYYIYMIYYICIYYICIYYPRGPTAGLASAAGLLRVAARALGDAEASELL